MKPKLEITGFYREGNLKISLTMLFGESVDRKVMLLETGQKPVGTKSLLIFHSQIIYFVQ